MIFGGQGETEKPEVDQPYETLDDLVIWDTEQEKWELPQLEVAPPPPLQIGRAHV